MLKTPRLGDTEVGLEFKLPGWIPRVSGPPPLGLPGLLLGLVPIGALVLAGLVGDDWDGQREHTTQDREPPT